MSRVSLGVWLNCSWQIRLTYCGHDAVLNSVSQIWLSVYAMCVDTYSCKKKASIGISFFIGIIQSWIMSGLFLIKKQTIIINYLFIDLDLYSTWAHHSWRGNSRSGACGEGGDLGVPIPAKQTGSRDVECHLAGGERAWAGVWGGAVPTRYSWTQFHSQRWLWNCKLVEKGWTLMELLM